MLLFMPVLHTEAKENIVIVIDPGHGGENLGGEYQSYTEKNMTLVTAKAMKERLEQFEGVSVYLTHNNTTDPDLTRAQRADFAKSVNADFMFSIHYNKSISGRLFGAEVWTSAFGQYYTKGASFAQIELQALSDMGIYSRGVKTRLGTNGNDYYGIIKNARKNQIPCVIIEHCHMDQKNDFSFYRDENALQNLGILDAECVAKYFQLKSVSLQEDYSNYKVPKVKATGKVMQPDLTPPDAVSVEVSSLDVSDNVLNLSVTAKDSQSLLIYYDISSDGGKTFSDLHAFDRLTNQMVLSLPYQSYKNKQVVVRVYNQYDLFTASTPNLIP